MSVSHAAVAAAILASGAFVNHSSPAAAAAAINALPDAGILSRAVFAFHADRRIFIDLHETPTDPRIFSKPGRLPRAPHENASAERWSAGDSL
ncbi:hypothetical protein AWB68_02782 [Caballeronia choica]|jgi:hypothetical protein|uniref:Uncharacterized protein n=1 Tax=Caballeronia choica TaxID=326476 RepID=A0A158IK54_9BURK|nr:hypothetical protein [Caballeronia choica]SAL57012.1 hypothetical protein AWB68_02782 [Caballeronia choica]